MANKKLLLHICCAPDATVVVERLNQQYDITGYFYNPNIHDVREYLLRAEEVEMLASNMKFPVELGAYDAEFWFQLVNGLEKEPEGGKRCDICIQMRLEETALFALHHEYDLFSTVLSVSPHKNVDIINTVGGDLSKMHNIDFLEANFKKKDGFKRSIELSKKYNLYRQNYCGCIFSKGGD